MLLTFAEPHHVAARGEDNMQYQTYSHCAGLEEVPASLRQDIVAAIDAIQVQPAKGAAPQIRQEFLGSIKESGWSEEVAVAESSDITITSIRNGIGLCLQTGNMSRMYADLIKLQTLYLNNSIKAAIYVLPSNPVAKQLGDNIAEATRLERELKIFKKAYYVPTVVFSLE